MGIKLSKVIGSELALVVLLFFSITWFVLEGSNVGWLGFFEIAVLAAVIIIQKSQNETAAHVVNLLYSLIMSVPGASERMSHLSEEDIRRIENLKKEYVKNHP